MYHLYEETISIERHGEVVWSRRINKTYSSYITKEIGLNEFRFDIYDEISQEMVFESGYDYQTFNDAVDAAEEYIAKNNIGM